MARATTGYLVLADISGYTRYLSSSEIDRGPAIAADLLEVVVGGLRPVVKLAKLEGDAAFFAGPGGRRTRHRSCSMRWREPTPRSGAGSGACATAPAAPAPRAAWSATWT